ncbi:hypothetical protein PsorP6_004620 [Peronosclerospora sorghi]|uniref:Uncharacterized protein n=1 Tax=Peronosclerospora sorghi TaxID=230839 RepID=A0ACC0VQ29_9STRA|nr:hypothetical protein PsorP6_004620 [Peronosclerospora sorghi]
MISCIVSPTVIFHAMKLIREKSPLKALQPIDRARFRKADHKGDDYHPPDINKYILDKQP